MLQLSFVNFKPNSYILVEGAPVTDYFFIIQSGKVQVTSALQLLGQAPTVLGAGDFVGVVACMSGHNQTENVIALTPVVAIMVKRNQYSELIMKNTPVAMKIVKSFANDMRLMNDSLTRLTLNSISIESTEVIFSIAEYYDEHNLTDVAIYGYYQYMKQNPHGLNIDKAKRRFIQLKPRSKAVYFEPTQELIRTYPGNTMIFSECQHGTDMFIIQEGSVAITKVVDGNEVTLALLKKGDMFGEMALLEKKPRSASAITREPTKLLVVNHTNFDQMVATQPSMISKLTTMFADRLWSMYRQLVNTQLKDAHEKMIDMIAIQIEKKNIAIMKGVPYDTGLSIMDVVNLCGITGVQQTSAINQLQNDKNIRVNNRKIIVPDVNELLKQAAFYRKQYARRYSND